jgi:SAM-dependent methyltransferase
MSAQIVVDRDLVHGRVLDYGCGYGFDASHYGWEAYDPYYRPVPPEGPYDTILCTLVLNVLSRRKRADALNHIRELLAESGHAYLAVPRNVPRTGKLGIHHSLQNYVVLSLPSIYRDDMLEIYDLTKNVPVDDTTLDHQSPRDRRRDR